MAFTKPTDKSFEHLVKQIVSKNYPNIATKGLVNVSIGTASSATKQADLGLTSSGTDAKELFIVGTSLWGGSRVVGE